MQGPLGGLGGCILGPMATQIVLAWTVDVTNTSFGPAQAAAALGAVPLYADVRTDPVLGQFFGLAVDDDRKSVV